MRKHGKNGGTWRPWSSARRGAPDLEAQKAPAGALRGAPPQGLDFRVPFGARWQARRARPSPENLTFLPLFSNSKPL